jgi:uncharacterized membrane protein HdeD (DUF308 family)
MVGLLARNWWALALRGVVAVVFGVLALFQTDVAALFLVTLFGAYALVDGVFAVVTAVMSHTGHWIALLLQGLAGIVAGIMAFAVPGIVGLALVYLIAGWAVATGVFQIVAAIRLRKEIEGEFWLGLSGILSILFGIVVAARPGIAGVVIIWIIGGYAIVFGILLIVLGFRLRAWQHRAGARA